MLAGIVVFHSPLQRPRALAYGNVNLGFSRIYARRSVWVLSARQNMRTRDRSERRRVREPCLKTHTKESGRRMSARGSASVATKRTKGAPSLKRKDYESRLRELHAKLVELQEWVRHEAKKICIVFEGRDGAGKGGTIKAITARVSPRIFRVVALPAPTEREKIADVHSAILAAPPVGGRSRHIRPQLVQSRRLGGTWRLLGFCTKEEAKRFLGVVPGGDEGTGGLQASSCSNIGSR